MLVSLAFACYDGQKGVGSLKLAACGIDCAECASYKATIHQDLDAAALLVPWYRGNGWIGADEGAEAILRKNPLCRGCWEGTEDCFFKCGCGRTDFRECCRERQIDHCGDCDNFPCAEYREWVSWSETHGQAMEKLLARRTKNA